MFTEVRHGEARTALLLALNVFLILMAYYILKTVREALILGEGTAELKSYLSGGQVIILAFVVPYYVSEGKSYLTVAIGCTGGRHRSVMIAERLRRSLAAVPGARVRVRHRDIGHG